MLLICFAFQLAIRPDLSVIPPIMHKALEHGKKASSENQSCLYLYSLKAKALQKLPKYYLSLYKGAERKGEIAIQYNE